MVNFFYIVSIIIDGHRTQRADYFHLHKSLTMYEVIKRFTGGLKR